MVLIATQVKRRRGTTAENDAFTGAEGEITVDTEKHELRVHDGETQGGFTIPTAESLNFASKSLDNLSANGEARFTGKANVDMDNITSTGKETVAGWGMPDYSAGIDILSSITSGYQAPKKGVVCFFTMSATLATSITVNNNLVLNKAQTTGSYSTSMFVPLEKNDVIKSTAVSGGSVIFFPFKGV